MASQAVGLRRIVSNPRNFAIRRVLYRDEASAVELADASDLDRRARAAQTPRVYRGETGISYDHRDLEIGLSFLTPHN